MGAPPLGLGHGNFDVHRKPAENHSPTNERRNWPGALVCACSVRSRPAPPVSVLCSPISESRSTHSAASVDALDVLGAEAAPRGADPFDAADAADALDGGDPAPPAPGEGVEAGAELVAVAGPADVPVGRGGS